MSAPREHEPWPQELIERFNAGGFSADAVCCLASFCTGLRRSDLVRLRWV